MRDNTEKSGLKARPTILSVFAPGQFRHRRLGEIKFIDMVTLTALYRKPDDPARFEEHYENVHSPLIEKIPGLRKMAITRYSKMLTPANQTLSDQPYLECMMYFDDMDSYKAAMASEEN